MSIRRITTIAAMSVVLAATSVSTAQASADGSGAAPSTVRYTPPIALPAGGLAKGTEVGEWGIDRDGKHFSFTYTVGSSVPASAPVAPDVTAGCSEYISDVGFYLAGTASAYFQWETSQTCVGDFGAQWLNTQMWRSSWSGPRGYNSWQGTPESGNAIIDWGWSVDCNDGGGTYTYYPVMQGFASNVGAGPEVRSNNDLREACGANAP